MALLTATCHRKMSRAEIKEHLEKAMAQHLENRQPTDASHPKFEVLDVEWYQEAKLFRCEFKVKMTLPDGKDTTGFMKQNIPLDFSKVE